ncbi:hypothetical protein FCM35_KLT20599 [Carex littledalei]|uniref:Uncharacterized protein n=1 Tax=Carex littledalei TaxID=544730 RepID=A0A833R7L9_9POAL|nr:hypothetical protein FCM35_KLT20599 [Carex littledalei]
MHQTNLKFGPYFTSFKLYNNPHYNDSPQRNQSLSYNPFISHQVKPLHSSPTMQNKGTQNEIDCLKAELEYERKMRRKVKSFNQVLVMELKLSEAKLLLEEKIREIT